MKPLKFMLIAGEPSGDQLASELVLALRQRLPNATFFGIGGPKMAASGVDTVLDLTHLAVTGLTDVLRLYPTFRRHFLNLVRLAQTQKPDAIIGVDYGGFNLRFARAISKLTGKKPSGGGWNPRIIQFVSPQVWASRPKRALQMEKDHDLLLSIFPFEKAWYASHAPGLRVVFVGHPMLDRVAVQTAPNPHDSSRAIIPSAPEILLLPGSRRGELKRHVPILLQAIQKLRVAFPSATARMVLPNDHLLALAKTFGGQAIFQCGGLAEAMTRADVALASTGTVTLECALHGLPTVTLYKTSWLTYEIGRRIITVNSLTMPNLLAGRMVFPEFIQQNATPENLARATAALLQNQAARSAMRTELQKIMAGLGTPGACNRAAEAIIGLFPDSDPSSDKP